MSFKSGFESRERESHSLTQRVAVSSNSGVRRCTMNTFLDETTEGIK